MKIAIPQNINDQIDFYVQKSDIECSGLGKVIVTDEGYEVTEIILIKQENTATHTEIDAQAVTKALYELRNSKGGMYFWWHSHVNMGVFWSGTDKDTIEEIGQHGLCVAVVFNKKRERRGAVWLKGTELQPNLFFDDIPVEVTHQGPSEEVKAAWAKEFSEKCKAKAYSNPDKQAWLNFSDARNSPRREVFDIVAFERDALNESQKAELSHLCTGIMYSFSPVEVDNDLKKILALVKKSKATKHEKKKAFQEYKEMAIEQKNYLAERESVYERHA